MIRFHQKIVLSTLLVVTVFIVTACGGGGGGGSPPVAATPSAMSAIANTTAQSLSVGTAMTSFSPLTPSGGSTPYTYSYTGTLPDGLNFNYSTGVVSGTPTATYAAADLVFSVKDASNVVASTTSTVRFTVGTVAGNWTATGNMMTERLYNTATLLPNGKVLITGGATFNTTTFVTGVASSAEIYDPATGLFTATGSMATPRSGHTATLLSNGTVLVAGGGDSSGMLDSAEIYDPATGLFTATGSMTSARQSHTATLLPGTVGRVLVVGGYQDTAEIYDPATGLFTATGSLVTSMLNPAATLLPNGMVLFTGKAFTTGGGIEDPQAELYDPTTGLFTTTGSMTAVRVSHAATLLPNGTVLVTGGASDSGLVADLASAEIYDPATGLFTATGSMTTARSMHTATLLSDGTVLVAGGGSASAEIYDPATGLFTATSSMSMGRDGHTATLLSNGAVLVAGGTFLGPEEVYQ